MSRNVARHEQYHKSSVCSKILAREGAAKSIYS